LEDAPPQFGMRVRATFFNHPDWTELRFAPQGSKKWPRSRRSASASRACRWGTESSMTNCRSARSSTTWAGAARRRTASISSTSAG
jgi:hypothetical protein